MTATSPDIAALKSVTKRFSGETGVITAIENISLSLEDGDTLAVVGPSGCGKSTLLLLLCGLESPTSGKILYKDEPLHRENREIALMLQNYGLFPWKTVKENVELGLKIRGNHFDPGIIPEILHELGIEEKLNDYPQQLSGGQRQRVALARAMVLKPSLLLLDEPFAALDTFTRERLQNLLCRLWQKRRFGLIVATHNIQEAVRLGRNIVIMQGKPGIIHCTINNPGGGTDSYRGSDEFYAVARNVRSELEHVM